MLGQVQPKSFQILQTHLLVSKIKHSIIEKISLSINELNELKIFSLKTNESPRQDDINFDVVKKCFGEINEPLKHLFNLSLENEIFPEKNENC